MKREAALLLLLVFAASRVIAQQPAPGAGTSLESAPNLVQVQSMLQSDVMRDLAWGTWWATQLKVTSALPQIQRNLEAHLKDSEVGDYAVIDTSLDALIQLAGATLSLDIIESVYRRGRTPQALILLARSQPGPQFDKFLLKLLDEEAGNGVALEWYAAADLLLMQKRPGLVASVLKDLRIQSYIVVCDAGTNCMHLRIGGDSSGDGGPGLGSIYPPWPYYTLSTVNGGLPSNLAPGTPILFQGPVSLTYNRGVASTYPAIVYRNKQGRYPPNPSTMDRLRYIAAAAPTIPMTIRGDEDISLFWKDIDAYKAETERFQNDLRGRYIKLVEQLRDAGLLSAPEFESVKTPPISFTIDDQRSVRTPAL